MPPKKKKPTGKRKKRLVPLDEIDTTVLSLQKLKEFCIDVNNAHTEEKQYTETLKLERDKLASMVAISREQQISYRNDIRAYDLKIQDTEHNHWKIMGEKRQKLIHLAHEKNIDCLDRKISSLSKTNGPKCIDICIQKLEMEISLLKTELIDWELKFAKEKTDWKINLATETSEIQQKNKELHLVMENKRENIANDKNKRTKQKFSDQYNTAEKIKNKGINQLIKQNTSFVNDLKHYYNKIVHHNLSVINTMKNSYEGIKADNAIVSKQLSQLNQKNQYLVHNLAKSQFEEKELQEKLSSSKRDQTQLKNIKKELDDNKNVLDCRRWELEALSIRLEKQIESSKEEANEDQSILIIRKSHTEQYILLLEYIVRHLYRNIIKIDSILKTDKWEQVSKSQDEVNYYLATVAHDRAHMYNFYREQLDKHGVHADDTGFQIYSINQLIRNAECLRVFVNVDVKAIQLE